MGVASRKKKNPTGRFQNCFILRLSVKLRVLAGVSIIFHYLLPFFIIMVLRYVLLGVVGLVEKRRDIKIKCD